MSVLIKQIADYADRLNISRPPVLSGRLAG